MRTPKRLAWLTLLLTWLLCNRVTATAAEDWGTATDGIQMSLSASSASGLTMSLRNISQQDKMLVLGMMLAPSVATVVKGKTEDVPTAHYQFFDAISVVVQDATGKSTELVVKGPPGVAGTIEPMEVPLPPGASYTLQTHWSDYVDPKTFGPLPKGSVQITAKYIVKDIRRRTNRHYWTGTLQSNKVSLKI